MKKIYALVLASILWIPAVFSQSIISVSPSTIPSSGSVTLTLRGYHTFFTLHSGYTVRLTQPDNQSGSTFTSSSTTVIDNEHLQATFNISFPAYGGNYRVTLTAAGGYLINWLNDAVFMTGTPERKLVSITPAIGVAGTTLNAQITATGAYFIAGTGWPSINYIQLTSENGPATTINATSITPIDSDHVNVSFVIPVTTVNSTYKITTDQSPYFPQMYKSGFVKIIGGANKGIARITPNMSFKGDSVYMTVRVAGTSLTTYPLNWGSTLMTGERNTYSLTVGSTSISTIDATHALIKWRLGTFAPEGDYCIRLYNSQLGYFYKHFVFRIKPPKMVGQIYSDVDSNAVFTAGNDYGLASRRALLLPDSVYGLTDIAGFYSFNPDSGNYSIGYVPYPNWTLTSSPATYTNIFASDSIQQGFDFGAHTPIPPPCDNTKHSFTVWEHALRCNSTGYSYWTIHNVTPTPQHGLIAHVHSPNLPVTYNSIAPDSIHGDTLFWNYVLSPNQTIHCDIRFQDPPAGDSVWYTNTDYALDAADIPICTFYEQYSFIVTCSCDPNDKFVVPTEDAWHTTTPMASDLDYTIRFQNTGNDTAFLVVIRDTLSAFLDLNTFEVLNSSHPVQTELSLRDNVAIFTFDPIVLPDSTTDYPGSNGFVKFRIHAKAGLPDSTVVTNMSNIYFDFNDAVATNTATSHLVYYVPPVASFAASDTGICVGQCIRFMNLSQGSTSWLWLFPGSNTPTSNAASPLGICYPDTGTFDVTLIASNDNGADTLYMPNLIVVNPLPPAPVITQMGNTLYCSTSPAYVSYQWFLDSTQINGATDTSYVATGPGTYTVLVTDANGCSNSAVFDIPLYVPQISASNFSIYPNPASNILFIRNNASAGEWMATLTDAMGRVIISKQMKNENESSLNLSGIAAGILLLKISDEKGFSEVIKVIKE